MADRRAMQDFSLSMHRFLTESVWQSLCSESLQPTQKCEALFEHCFELLGLRCPSENTFACMVALVHLQKAWSSFEAFTALHAVKAQWRSFTKRKNKRLTRVGDEAPYQAMLPASYEELPQFMQDGFGDQRPAPCPVQECKVLEACTPSHCAGRTCMPLRPQSPALTARLRRQALRPALPRSSRP